MNSNKVFIYILGTAQDGGYPHIGCKEECCKFAWENSSIKRLPSSLALIDQNKKKYWLFDITPEIKEQIHILDQFNCSLEGVFITHAHSGHRLQQESGYNNVHFPKLRQHQTQPVVAPGVHIYQYQHHIHL